MRSYFTQKIDEFFLAHLFSQFSTRISDDLKLNLAWNIFEHHGNHEFIGSHFNDFFNENPEYLNQRFFLKRGKNGGKLLKSEKWHLKPMDEDVRKFLNMINSDKKEYFLDDKKILGIGGESIVLSDERENKDVAVKFVPIFDKHFKVWFLNARIFFYKKS